jgi:hypothetical protein
MKLRKSLSQKVDELLAIGSLTIYTLEQAINSLKSIQPEEEIKTHYAKGRSLFMFEDLRNEDECECLSIKQFNTFSRFINDVAYPIFIQKS